MTSRRDFIQKMGAGTFGLGLLMTNELSGCMPWTPQKSMSDDEFWKMVRSQYPLTNDRIYLNTGGLGPASYHVLDAFNKTMMDLQRLSETGHSKIDQTRKIVAPFLGAKDTEICFTRNATEGNATVASGLKLNPGDEVIFESHAHPGGAIPWMTRQKEFGIKVKLFEPDPTSVSGNLQRINDLITPRTKVIQVSHITAPTGIRMPVKEIAQLAKSKGIWFHIDGAQSAGMIKVDLAAIGCDSYATSCHKWLGATLGSGILFVREDRLDEVIPTDVGAYSDSEYELPNIFEYNHSAIRYEAGTNDSPKIVGIGEAVNFQNDIGIEKIESYGKSLAKYLQSELRNIPGVTVLSPEKEVLSASITTFKTDTVKYDELFRYFLSEHKLRCRIVTEAGLDALRVSTHVYNSKSDCDKVVVATKDILGI